MVVFLSCESPFVFEDAVPVDKFFDRGVEIDFFVRSLRVKRKMLLCIVAPLKYGKTSLMLKYLEILKARRDIIPVYINLKIIGKPILRIVDELYKYGVDLRREYDKALTQGELLGFFDVLNRCLEGNDSWLFLLFDEFHLLPSRVRNEGFLRGFSDEDVFGFFRGYAEGRRISYIICGSVIEPLMDALDVWGGRFQVIYLGPFNMDDAVYMLKKLFAEGNMSIDDRSAEIIAEAAGYHPFYMQYMGHQIYMQGEISSRTIRLAKQRLFEFLSPIFITYLKRIRSLGKGYLDTLARIIEGKPLTMDDRIAVADLLKIGILKPKNAKFEFVDPLFKRYVKQIIRGLEPTEVTVVGHWAERIVGNYLLRKGYYPYYSHDSRGAFDIYVKISGVDVGIQVEYTARDEVYLSRKDVEKILLGAKETNWVPILALVGKQIRFFSDIRPGKYSIEDGHTEIEQALR